jgi:hypothetical protein
MGVPIRPLAPFLFATWQPVHELASPAPSVAKASGCRVPCNAMEASTPTAHLRPSAQEFAFMPQAAPQTAQHIFDLVQMGLYTSNHFFRVDKGFVAQCGDVASSRTLPLNERQKV